MSTRLDHEEVATYHAQWPETDLEQRIDTFGDNLSPCHCKHPQYNDRALSLWFRDLLIRA